MDGHRNEKQKRRRWNNALHFFPLNFNWYFGYIVSAPPLAASSGSSWCAGNSVKDGFVPEENGAPRLRAGPPPRRHRRDKEVSVDVDPIHSRWFARRVP